MIVVVGGGGAKVGKTALVCGIVAALPEREWTAVKITRHDYGRLGPVWEETQAGQGTDTARYLAAGAKRALLISAPAQELGKAVEPLLQSCRDGGPSAALIFESNSVLEYLDPDVCLAVDLEGQLEPKPSFQALAQRADARVRWAGCDGAEWAPRPVFRLEAMERLSPAMAGWLRQRLS